ncbi:MAG: hypothetical protein PsegKO_28420 [Pseudohongiellaceae bacterium]
MHNNNESHSGSAQRFLPVWLFAASLVFVSGVRADPEVSVMDSLFPHSFPLTQTGSGSLTVVADLGGVNSEFLLDTGASMITVSPQVFAELEILGSAVKVRRVAARSAGGRLQALDVYRVEKFVLGKTCELGPVEVAVMRSGGRNLLGLAALEQAAPFAISTAPPELGLARCGAVLRIAAH